MIISQLPAKQFAAMLDGAGVKFRIGPFIACIRTTIPALAAQIYCIYGNHELAAGEIAEFHLSIVARRSVFRPLSPEVHCLMDGQRLLSPTSADRAFDLLQQGIKRAILDRVNHYLLFRAAAVERNGSTLLLFSPEEYGESALCAALAYSGYRLLSDEISILDLQTGELMPMPLGMSLRNDSVNELNELLSDITDSMAVDRSLAHFAPPATSVKRSDEPAEAKWVVFAEQLFQENSEGASAQIESASDSETFILLSSNSHNYEILAAVGFRAVTDIARSARGYYLSYSGLDGAVSKLNELTDVA